MKLVIGNTPYEIEFSFEASLCEDCVDQLFNYVGASADGALRQQSGTVFKTLSGTPSLVVTLFYAGLLEHNPVKNKDEAKELIKKYFYENKGKKNANFGCLFQELNQQMEKDGFFDLVGLTSAMEQLMEQIQKPDKKVAKIPTDHQKPQASEK